MTMNTLRRPVVGGFQAPASVGVGEQATQEVHSRWDTMAEVEEQLRMEGLQPIPPPTYAYTPVTEEMLTTADNAAYSTYYAQQNAWWGYLVERFAHVRAELIGVNNEIRIVEAHIRKDLKEKNKLSSKEDRLSATEIDDAVTLDPYLQQCQHRKQVLDQKKLMIEALHNNAEGGVKIISRQVEVRKAEAEQNRVNIPGRGYSNNMPRRP
jgi:hypothetical protein